MLVSITYVSSLQRTGPVPQDEEQWPGPPYSPKVFDGSFPIGEQANPHDLYHSVMGGWYEYMKDPDTTSGMGYDWIRIKSDPEEASW